ncbi:BrnA antitoxin family protein, partial [Gammaproteobacteria bacterium]|nr:BrnA antitoxin family protein [Gammaproteobacteria bacterium]
MIDERFRDFIQQCIDDPDGARDLLKIPSNPSYIRDKRVLLDLFTSETKDVIEVTPVQYLAVRNTIMEALYYRQTEIDGIIERFKNDEEYDSDEDRQYFRIWLDVTLKLCNVPSRIQVSTNLEIPMASKTFNTGTVSKLVYNMRGSLSRMFVMDKTAKAYGTMPVTVPLGRVLTYYMSAYLLYVMPEGSKYVFNESDGSKWKGESEEFINFLCQGIQLPCWLVPRQHSLRIIGINAMAALHHFDSGKLDDLGTLSRHTRNVMLTDYTFWSELHQERFQNLEQTDTLLYLRIDDEMDIDNDLEEDVLDQMDTKFLSEALEEKDVREMPASVPVQRIEGSSMDNPIVIEIGKGNTRPICALCGQMVIFQKYIQEEDKIAFLLSCANVHEDEDKEWFYWQTEQSEFNRMVRKDGNYVYAPYSSSKTESAVSSIARSKLKKLEWYVRNTPLNPIIQKTCYVGIDISPKVLACAVKTFDSMR